MQEEWKWKRSLEIKSEYLLEEYGRIVQEFFPGIANIEEFVAAFSEIFYKYQSLNPKKLDPDSIRERYISCSSAGALLGVWWMQQFPQLRPIFLIEDSTNSGVSKAAAHVNVALPLIAPITEQEALAAFYSSTVTPSTVQLIDWTEHSRMKQSNPAKRYVVYPVEGIRSYLRNRLKYLGLTQKYSSKNIEHMSMGRTENTEPFG